MKPGSLTEVARPADDDIWSMIFEPAFSTTEHVTDVSGRGVGMDVVRRNVRTLGGNIGVESSAEGGSRLGSFYR